MSDQCAYALSYGPPCILGVHDPVHGYDAECSHEPRNDCHPYQPPKEPAMPEHHFAFARVVEVQRYLVRDGSRRPTSEEVIDVTLQWPEGSPIPAPDDEVVVQVVVKAKKKGNI